MSHYSLLRDDTAADSNNHTAGSNTAGGADSGAHPSFSFGYNNAGASNVNGNNNSGGYAPPTAPGLASGAASASGAGAGAGPMSSSPSAGPATASAFTFTPKAAKSSQGAANAALAGGSFPVFSATSGPAPDAVSGAGAGAGAGAHAGGSFPRATPSGLQGSALQGSGLQRSGSQSSSSAQVQQRPRGYSYSHIPGALPASVSGSASVSGAMAGGSVPPARSQGACGAWLTDCWQRYNRHMTPREYLRLNAWQKWQLFRRPPWKFILNLLIVVCTTMQVVLLNTYFAPFSRANAATWAFLMTPRLNPSGDTMGASTSYNLYQVSLNKDEDIHRNDRHSVEI